MNRWIISPIKDYYIIHNDLKNKCINILVTYQIKTGRRYVAKVLCNNGYIEKKLNGIIIAWMPLPEPYQGDCYEQMEKL